MTRYEEMKTEVMRFLGYVLRIRITRQDGTDLLLDVYPVDWSNYGMSFDFFRQVLVALVEERYLSIVPGSEVDMDEYPSYEHENDYPPPALTLAIPAKTVKRIGSLGIERENKRGFEKQPSSVIYEITPELLAKLSRARNWEAIRFGFGNDPDRILISINGERIGELHFSDLGFQKKSSNQEQAPVRSWAMMKTMALNKSEHPADADYQKTKADLERRLRNLFQQLEGSPITHDSSTRKYKCLIRLYTTSDQRNALLDRKAEKRQFLRKV